MKLGTLKKSGDFYTWTTPFGITLSGLEISTIPFGKGLLPFLYVVGYEQISIDYIEDLDTVDGHERDILVFEAAVGSHATLILRYEIKR